MSRNSGISKKSLLLLFLRSNFIQNAMIPVEHEQLHVLENIRKTKVATCEIFPKYL